MIPRNWYFQENVTIKWNGSENGSIHYFHSTFFNQIFKKYTNLNCNMFGRVQNQMIQLPWSVGHIFTVPKHLGSTDLTEFWHDDT